MNVGGWVEMVGNGVDVEVMVWNSRKRGETLGIDGKWVEMVGQISVDIRPGFFRHTLFGTIFIVYCRV